VDPIEDLVALRFGVRVDQSGKVISDFHTAHDHRTGDSMPLSTRFYLADACFVAGIQGDRELLESIESAVQHPKFPLFLGRRSCPVTGEISLGVRDATIEESFEQVEWQASGWYRRRSGKTVYLHTYVDAPSEETRGDLVLRDEPQSFDPRRRLHSWRVVRPDVLAVANPEGRGNDIDFFAAVGGA
jgi:CRISPR system Cascade subunit CasD